MALKSETFYYWACDICGTHSPESEEGYVPEEDVRSNMYDCLSGVSFTVEGTDKIVDLCNTCSGGRYCIECDERFEGEKAHLIRDIEDMYDKVGDVFYTDGEHSAYYCAACVANLQKKDRG